MSTKSQKSTTSSVWNFEPRYLKGVGDKLAAIFSKSDIHTLWDLLLFLPRTYEDRRHFHDIHSIRKHAESGDAVIGLGMVEKVHHRQAGPRGRRWMEMVVLVQDPQKPIAEVQATSALAPRILFTWFHNYTDAIAKKFPVGSSVVFRGKPAIFRGQLQVSHPDLQSVDAQLPIWEFGGYVPVYREIGGITTKYLRKLLYQALMRPEVQHLPETLPENILRDLKLPSLKESFLELHFPKTWLPQQEEPRPEGAYYMRLVFEELFVLALALHIRASQVEEERAAQKWKYPEIQIDETALSLWKSTLPYSLTEDQERVLQDILNDLSASVEKAPMHRLVQGDVGSGKTIVAFLAALMSMKAGYQVAMMAPTEILANQHYKNFTLLFPELANECVLLKGALTAKQKKETRELLKKGQVRFVIGTQALLTETTMFEKLGLVIVDEQHRFGVEQRITLRKQVNGLSPHLLVMTATPIPRSLALTLYGDLNLSTIRQKPAGRTPIKTYLVKKKSEDALAKRLEKFLAEKRQIYIVYPVIEESETGLTDVMTGHQTWSQRFPKYRVGLLHGQMKSKDKERIMNEFKNAQLDVLISTTVIEVGVDVPNATVIVIEHAERFGLSQLHQLRGRVGRGAQESFCVLVGPDWLSPLVEQRLKIIESSDDGFYVAEKDLELRGPGEFLGRRQSGLPGFRVAHILRDAKWLELARQYAQDILKSDPRLEKKENLQLRQLIDYWWKGRIDYTLSG